jgi:hypothetical protein
MVAAKEEQKPMCTHEELKSAYELRVEKRRIWMYALQQWMDWLDLEGS